jgi:hypothetical protein
MKDKVTCNQYILIFIARLKRAGQGIFNTSIQGWIFNIINGYSPEEAPE